MMSLPLPGKIAMEPQMMKKPIQNPSIIAWLLISLLMPLSTTLAQQDEEELLLDLVAAPANPGLEFLSGGNSPTTIEHLREMEKVFARLEKQVASATVNIQVGDAQGSGVVVSRDGYILTAAHVIERPYNDAKITFADGSTANAVTLGMNRVIDSGMLKITDKGKWKFLDIGESRDLAPGKWVMAIGHPGGLTEGRGLVYRAGRINDVDGRRGFLKTDCALVGGDSGGPLVDLNGFVIGIHSRIGQQLIDNFHVPIDIYSQEWDELAKGVVVGGTESWMGIAPDRDETSMLKVKSVNKYSGAAKAGIQAGDVILKVNEYEIENIAALLRTLRKFRPRDKVKVKISRDDEEIELEVTLGYK